METLTPWENVQYHCVEYFAWFCLLFPLVVFACAVDSKWRIWPVFAGVLLAAVVAWFMGAIIWWNAFLIPLVAIAAVAAMERGAPLFKARVALIGAAAFIFAAALLWGAAASDVYTGLRYSNSFCVLDAWDYIVIFWGAILFCVLAACGAIRSLISGYRRVISAMVLAVSLLLVPASILDMNFIDRATSPAVLDP